MAMGAEAQAVYELAMGALTLYRVLSVEQREPTIEELRALSERNRAQHAQIKADVEARPD